ncbi:hypothetical protein GCM10011584_19860 [Nocardioides phosphati]|uniref:DUF4307 domain-containing protein n=1 Tax=Nocardioides phosphati TaxID=1867775 RepID=A0ABQ2N9P4_9ACTN|nr:DUF4307 domain-containing protein [Nocardioides phosphati]GGO89724.1 hypothetical protein GCM10011584_19860 [Nocardioides phosphati]
MTDALADRYGRRPDGRRFPLALVVGLVVGVPFLIWVAWVWWSMSTPDVQSTDRNFTIVDAHLVVADIEVTLSDDAVDPSCRIQALAEDKTAVGSKQFTPVDGANRVKIRTERQATAIDLIGCTAKGQNRPR